MQKRFHFQYFQVLLKTETPKILNPILLEPTSSQ
jgi:hypothetical protein